MAIFTWGMHPDAEKEVEESSGVYGFRFKQEVHQWLQFVAIEAAKGHELGGGADPTLPPILHYVTSQRLRTWLFAPKFFFNQTFLQALRSLVHAARTRKPPYEYWASEKYFADVASSFDQTVKAFFIVDRVNLRVTFTKFVDLPGE